MLLGIIIWEGHTAGKIIGLCGIGEKMVRIATDYLDISAQIYPEKIAFVDENRGITFGELQQEAYGIATQLIDIGLWKRPIAVYLDKSVECISAYAGIAYSGNFYSPIDTKMPIDRIQKIIGKLIPEVILTDKAHKDEAMAFSNGSTVVCLDESNCFEINKEKIHSVTKKIIDTDILYVLFTSGSTGTPKGVIISHRGIVDLTEWAVDKFSFDNTSIMANQTPFYFSMSVFDIYQTLRNGSTTYIVPHQLFSFPAKLMKYLNEHKINTLIWVPSALCYISALRALNSPHLDSLRNIFFGGEVMPVKQLNKWMKEYPNVKFVNLYGPTEVTDTCAFYEITRSFDDSEMLPIGEACRNKDILLLGERDELITDNGITGEICVRGSGIAYGYYNDLEKTEEAFVQDPLNAAYQERIYRTGDLGKYNDVGELVYISRKDFQIKHQGHRIELSEIETACSSIEGIEANCCLYDSVKKKIVLFYVGEVDGKEVSKQLSSMLPDYMVPGRRLQLEKMPYNLNGKIDRQELKKYLQAEEK